MAPFPPPTAFRGHLIRSRPHSAQQMRANSSVKSSRALAGCAHPKGSPRCNRSDGQQGTNLAGLAYPKGPSPLNWSVLQRYPELGAPLAVWLRELGPNFEPFKRLYLITDDQPAQRYPCPLWPGRSCRRRTPPPMHDRCTCASGCKLLLQRDLHMSGPVLNALSSRT